MITEINFSQTSIELESADGNNPRRSFRTAAFQDMNLSEPRVEVRETQQESAHTIEESERILCGQLVGSKISGADRRDLEARLAQLLKSPEIRALNRAARDLSQRTGVPEAKATRMILESLKELNSIWDQILISEGVDQLNR